MAKLIYFTPTSLDGYIADAAGDYDWAVPDEEAFAFINDVMRPIGTYLYGRKMYQTMAVWDTPEVIPDRTPAMLDFARMWQAADKIVYSNRWRPSLLRRRVSSGNSTRRRFAS
jgi:dihydrofolate reductase